MKLTEHNKYKDLSGNIILFSISSFGHKILAFLLIPLYTNFLTTEQYGIIDLIATTVNLLIPIFTLNISEAVMRFTIDDKSNDSYLGIGIKILIKGTCILASILTALWFLPILLDYKQYYIWILAIYAVNSIYNIEQNYLRAVNRIPTMVIASLLNSLIMLLADVILIAVFQMGFNGYYIAMFLGMGSASIYMNVKARIHRHVKWAIHDQDTIKKACLYYCVPTIFTTLSWWVNSSLDRYFVTELCGLGENGIYSMAYKIPSILTMFQNIFNQAWTLSAITEFNADDPDGFFGKTYELYSSSMLLVTSGIMLFNILLSGILYANDFFEAWHYVPMLLMSSLFSALAGYLGGIFAAVKDMKVCAYTVIISAVINTILNVLLIPRWGIQGAAVATTVAYMVSWAGRMLFSRKYIRMKINLPKNIAGYVVLFIQLILALTENHYYYGQIALIMLLMILYFKQYKEAVSTLFRRFRKR